MRVLSRANPPLRLAVGLARGFLLVASSEAELGRLAPYAWRTMPTLPAPASPAAVVASLEHEALAAHATSAWEHARAFLSERDREQRARHGGRAPDFGDPKAIVDAADVVVKRRAAFLAGAREASFTLEASNDSLVADLEIAPGDDAGPLSALSPGDVRPLAEAPADAVLSLLVRDPIAVRADDAVEIAATLAHALGSRESEEDSRAIGSAIDAWAKGRGDWLEVSLTASQARAARLTSPGGVAAAQALRSLVELGGRPVFAEPIHTVWGLGPPAIAAARVDGLTQASIATFGGSSSFQLAWAVREDQLVAVAGDHAARRLAEEASSPSGHLGDDPRVARALSAIGNDAALVLLAEPLGLDATRPASEVTRAPALLAWGRRNGSAWLHAEAADVLLREVVRLQSGL